MALRGTLKDFGIADVFSLIGQQAKTGSLKAVTKDEQITVYFVDGGVVRSEASRRQKQELLGNMLVRAGVVTEPQLQAALERQRVERKRIGDLLISNGAVTLNDLQTFTRLQTTETVYRMFLWRNGTYEFTQLDTPPEAGHPTVRAETLLMEGFRQADEWPEIRRKIASYGITFEIVEDLDTLLAAEVQPTAKQGDELDFDLGFGDDASVARDPRLRNIEAREQQVYGLILPGRDVQKLIDLSRLGEFETCKALANLLDAGIIKTRAQQVAPSAEATVGGISARTDAGLSGGLAAQAGYLAAGLVGWALIMASGLPAGVTSDLASDQPAFLSTGLEVQVGYGAQVAIEHALRVYRAAHGSYPADLEALVGEGLIAPGLLRYPWRQPYVYERAEAGFRLMRPLY